MLIAILVGFMFISGGIAVHQYLREHPPSDLGPRFAKVYNADHPRAKARARRDEMALKKGETVSDGAMVALGRILWFFGRHAARGIRSAGRGVIEQGKARAAADNAKAEEMAGAGAAEDGGAAPAATSDTASADPIPAEAEQDTPIPDAAPQAPNEEAAPMALATMNALYEASEAVSGQKFEGIIAIERFATAVASGCEAITAVWSRWAERLAGPLNVDDSVVDHIRACAPHQATIAGLTGESAALLTSLIDRSIDDALGSGQAVPHHSMMNSAGGYPAIPAFYERFGTYITHRHEDIRGELLLMSAVQNASTQQAQMFRATARQMEDQKNVNVKAAAEKYYQAANVQDAITAQVEAAHMQFGVIIRMTIRALAESSMKAPNANMVGVG